MFILHFRNFLHVLLMQVQAILKSRLIFRLLRSPSNISNHSSTEIMIILVLCRLQIIWRMLWSSGCGNHAKHVGFVLWRKINIQVLSCDCLYCLQNWHQSLTYFWYTGVSRAVPGAQYLMKSWVIDDGYRVKVRSGGNMHRFIYNGIRFWH